MSAEEKARKKQRIVAMREEKTPDGLVAKFKYYFKRYAYILIPVHLAVCGAWFAALYLAVRSGLDVVQLMETLHMPVSWVDRASWSFLIAPNCLGCDFGNNCDEIPGEEHPTNDRNTRDHPHPLQDPRPHPPRHLPARLRARLQRTEEVGSSADGPRGGVQGAHRLRGGSAKVKPAPCPQPKLSQRPRASR